MAARRPSVSGYSGEVSSSLKTDRPGRAVFLDRDGVLNRNIWYEDTGAWEAPRSLAEFDLHEGVLPALALLRDAGFALFVVSNQPNVVNGKGSADVLAAQDARLREALAEAGVDLAEAFYCTHHPDFTGECPCRKPSPHFLEHAARSHNIALARSWMVGDRVTDMQCGRGAGARTAWIHTGQEPDSPDPALVDLMGKSLAEVAAKIRSAP